MPVSVFENKPGHHYRTEIPNIVDDLDLSPSEFRLYLKLKRICGDEGKCWKSLDHLAEEANMSRSSVMTSLNKLCKSHPLLNGRSLILVYERFKENGSRDTHLIEIVDVWDLNEKLYKKEKQIDHKKHSLKGGCKYGVEVVQNLHQGGVKFTHKEEPYKKLEEESEFHSCLSNLDLSIDDKRRLSKLPEAEVSQAVKSIQGHTPKKTLIALIRDAIKHPTSYKPKRTKKSYSLGQEQALKLNAFIGRYEALAKVFKKNLELFEEGKVLLPGDEDYIYELNDDLSNEIRESCRWIANTFGHVVD